MIIEKYVRDYLGSKLDIPVYLEIPNKAEPPFVVVEKTGSSVYDHVITSTLAIQSYGASMYDASLINEFVKEDMIGMMEEREVEFTSMETDYNFTDTSTKRYRYQAVFQVVHF